MSKRVSLLRNHRVIPMLALAAVGCGAPAPAEQPTKAAAEPGSIAVARDTTLTVSFTASGMALPVRKATLSTRLMGSVTAVLVQEGDRVEQGQVLARIDARELVAKRNQVDAGLAEAEAVRANALTQANRFRALYADSAATRSQLDQVETGLARAEAGVATARAGQAELEALDAYATIRAPFAGTVTRRYVDPGAFAAPGAPIIEVQDAARLRISVAAPPAIAGALRRGHTISGTIEGRVVGATVEGVVPAGAGAMATVNLLVDNAKGEYLSMSAATIQVPTGSRQVLVVPASALVREGDLIGVRVRGEDGFALRWVTLGDATSQDGALVEIRSGLRAGDTVAVGAP